MTTAEILTVIDRIAAAWPWVELTDSQADVWCDVLEPLDADLTAETLERLIRTSERPPVAASFLAEYRNREERAAPSYLGLPSPPVNRDGVARLLAAAREALERPRVHFHERDVPDGWRNCPTCKSIPPSGRTQDVAYRGPGGQMLVRAGDVVVTRMEHT